MKPGTRALGIAESYRDETSTIAGSVVRADCVVDGIAIGSCTVGGTDATDAILDLWASLDREDIQYLLVAGIAPAWFNIVDLHHLHDTTGLPTLSISFEGSSGLGDAIDTAFEGTEKRVRLDCYRAQPSRLPVTVNGEQVFVRSVGLESAEAKAVVRRFTPAGGRPEPLRVARLVARAVENRV